MFNKECLGRIAERLQASALHYHETPSVRLARLAAILRHVGQPPEGQDVNCDASNLNE